MVHEWHVKDPGTVDTFEFHRDRERARHLEQEAHRPRLLRAAEMVEEAAGLCWARYSDPEWQFVTVSDLGCGDGGLLEVLKRDEGIAAWGYDFAPANQAGWPERGVAADPIDVFSDLSNTAVVLGNIVVITEVLEHLADPHGVVKWLAGQEGDAARYVVASSPATENPATPDECHAWIWDEVGYRDMFTRAGFRVLRQELVTWSQVLLLWRP